MPEGEEGVTGAMVIVQVLVLLVLQMITPNAAAAAGCCAHLELVIRVQQHMGPVRVYHCRLLCGGGWVGGGGGGATEAEHGGRRRRGR